jgi:hypothetical protein
VGEREHSALILDLSPSGLFVQTHAKTQRGERLRLAFSHEDVALDLKVEVVRTKTVPQSLLAAAKGGIGVRIASAPEEYYQMLASLGVSERAKPQFELERGAGATLPRARRADRRAALAARRARRARCRQRRRKGARRARRWLEGPPRRSGLVRAVPRSQRALEARQCAGTIRSARAETLAQVDLGERRERRRGRCRQRAGHISREGARGDGVPAHEPAAREQLQRARITPMGLLCALLPHAPQRRRTRSERGARAETDDPLAAVERCAPDAHGAPRRAARTTRNGARATRATRA